MRRYRTRLLPQAPHAALERLRCREAANLCSGGGGRHGESGKATVHPDKPTMIVARAGWVTALRVEIRRVDIEADEPASAMPTTGREQDPSPRRHHRPSGLRIVSRVGTKQSPQPTGVVMYTNHADPGQGHGAGMAVPDPDRAGAAAARLIAESEALAAATFAFAPREADLPCFGLASPTLFVGRQGTTKVDGGFLKDLCRYLVSPYQAGSLLGDYSVGSSEEAASSGLASLPGIECVDQIEPRPWHGYRWVASLFLDASVTNRRHWLHAKREAPA